MQQYGFRIIQRSALICLLLLISGSSLKAQIKNPIKWTFSASSNGAEATLKFTATLDEGWHVYSQFISDEGPKPTAFKFEPSAEYSLIGKVKEEGDPVKTYDSTFMLDVIWFTKSVTFVQKVKPLVPSTTIKGLVEFMVCTEIECLVPDARQFSFEVKADLPKEKKTKAQSTTPGDKASNKGNQVFVADAHADSALTEERKTKTTLVNDFSTIVIRRDSVSVPEREGSASQAGQSLWTIFIAGFLGGLAAFIMPCIFPMVPFTLMDKNCFLLSKIGFW